LPTGHTPPGATLWPKGAPHLRPHRGGGPSPTGHLCPPPPPLAREADGPHREKGSHALTGLPLATYWPPTGPLLAIRGGLPLAKGEAPTGQWDGRGSLWPKGSRPLTGLPLATHWPQRGGAGAPSPGPPPTDHLRTHSPHQPIVAFGREASPTPQTFGSGGLREGEGFSVHRVPIRCCPCALSPLWGPP
jgi:hypothetical protein